jgi:hypothetical protein
MTMRMSTITATITNTPMTTGILTPTTTAMTPRANTARP